MAERIPRSLLWRWTGWFGLANAVVLAVIGLQFLGHYGGGGTALSWLYLVTIYVSHHASLALLPLLLVTAPLILFWPRRRAVMAVGVLLFALVVALIQLDSLLWSQSRFHINLLTARILGWQSWVFVAVMFLIGLVFESLLARGVWNWVEAKPRRGGGRVTALVIVCLIVAQSIYAWSDASYYTPVTGLAQQLPVHRGVTAKKFMMRTGLVDIQQSRERQLAERLAAGDGAGPGGALDYPRTPLQCSNDAPMNVLILMLDAWRFDMLNDTVTPRLQRWAGSHAQRFDSHFAGGNSSRMGVFSFFYGLPPGYFKSFEAVQRPALLVEEAQRQGYQMGLYTSADMYRPVTLDRTAFASVPDLRVTPERPQAPAWERDEDIVRDWTTWLDEADPDRPFFGFLFFDATNGRSSPPGHPVPMEVPADHPEREEFAAYLASVHWLDGVVMDVIEDLERRGLADDTVVLVTSDHGEEFQESGPEFQIHGSGYSRWQLQVPLLLAWPGMAPAVYDYRTSHYDVAPTLLRRLLGCANDPADLSVGGDLFDGESWDWMVAGSYFNYAVLEPDQITVTFPNGLYEVRDWDYRVLPRPEFRSDVLQSVMEANRRFHR
ncbi:MAG: DUF3413 domain-containing protein [Gammaproteobacteria bacterium]